MKKMTMVVVALVSSVLLVSGVLLAIYAFAAPAQVDLSLAKTVDDDTTIVGQRITYTIAVDNNGVVSATGGVVSDTLPPGLIFAGPVTLDPPQAGASLATSVGDLPILASGLTITAGERITLTFPVVVAGGARITNTAAVTSSQVIVPQIGQVGITVANIPPVAWSDTYGLWDEPPRFAVPAPGVLGNDSDVNFDMLTAVLDSGPLSGTLDLNADGSFIYTPGADFAGVDTFTYHAHDGVANSNVATATILVRPGWLLTMTQVTTNTNTQWRPSVSDRYVVWQDQRNGNADIYGYDLSTSTEFTICTNAFNQEHPLIYGDTVVWYDWRNGNADVYAYDLGTLTETPIVTNTNNQRLPVIYGDIVVWNDWRNGNWDVYGYDLSSQTEFPICTNAAHQYFPRVGGRYAVWWDERNGIGNWDIYAFDLQTLTEIPVATNPSNQGYPAVHGDIVAWIDQRNGNWDIYGYDFSTWTEFPICTNTSDQFRPWVFEDVVVWFDMRNGNQDIYGYNIATGKEFQITTNTSDQRHPKIFGDVVAWHDRRDGDYNIYAVRLLDLPLTKTVDSDAPVPGQRIVYTITVDNDGLTEATDGVVSDPLPPGLTFAGPVALDPPQAGASLATNPGDLPTLASGLTISVGKRITLTFPVTVDLGLAAGTRITNSATVFNTSMVVLPTSWVGITITNAAPVAASDAYTTDEDTVFTTGDVLANDSDPNDDDLAVDSLDDSGTLGLVTDNGDGTFDYDPNGQFEYLAPGEQGLDGFIYVVADTGGLTDTATVTITVTGVNHAPIAGDDGVSTDEDTPVTVSVLDNDADPDADDTLSVDSFDTAGTLGSVTHNPDDTFGYDPDGQFEYLAPGEQVSDAFVYVVADTGGLTDTATVVITVTGVNDPPEFTSIPVETATVGEPYTYAVIAHDPDAEDVLTFTAPVSATWLRLTQESTRTATLSGTPASMGDYPVELQVTDVQDSDVQTFTITVSESGAPMLQVDKRVDTGGLAEMPLGGVVTYTVVVRNAGDGVASSVVMTDPLPAAVSFDSQLQGSALLPLAGGVYRWGPYDVAAHTVYTISFTANVTDSADFAGQVVTNTAYASAANAAFASGDASFAVEGKTHIYLPVVLRNSP